MILQDMFHLQMKTELTGEEDVYKISRVVTFFPLSYHRMNFFLPLRILLLVVCLLFYLVCQHLHVLTSIFLCKTR